MRHRSKKTAAAYREHGPEREAFLAELQVCAVCRGIGFFAGGIAVHEMTNGQNRMRGFGIRAAWLPACGDCNCNRLTDKNEWPLARQLALKLIVDPAYFDLREIRRILAPEGHPNPPRVVDEHEILAYVKELLTERRAA